MVLIDDGNERGLTSGCPGKPAPVPRAPCLVVGEHHVHFVLFELLEQGSTLMRWSNRMGTWRWSLSSTVDGEMMLETVLSYRMPSTRIDVLHYGRYSRLSRSYASRSPYGTPEKNATRFAQLHVSAIANEELGIEFAQCDDVLAECRLSHMQFFGCSV